MRESVTVLLTGCGAPGAPGIIRCLRKNGEREIRIVGVDMNENASARPMVDAFYPVPAAEEPGFAGRVLEICRKERAAVVLSIVTRELEVFSAARGRFEAAGVKINVMDPEPLHIANNKGLLLTAMREAGLPTPEFRVVCTADEAEAAIGALGYPERAIVVKPTFGNGSRGTRILDPRVSRYDLFFKQKPNSMYISFSELMETLRERDSIPEMMVMEYLPGEEYGIDALCDRGETLIMAGRHNFSVNSSIPGGCVLENRDKPFEMAETVIRLLNLNGNINFDFKYDRQNRPRVIEINPRLSATIVSYAPAGVNFPYLAVKQLLGEPLPQARAVEETVMRRRYAEVFYGPDGAEIDW